MSSLSVDIRKRSVASVHVVTSIAVQDERPWSWGRYRERQGSVSNRPMGVVSSPSCYDRSGRCVDRRGGCTKKGDGTGVSSLEEKQENVAASVEDYPQRRPRCVCVCVAFANPDASHKLFLYCL